jgi:hypothetical protein
MKTAASGSSSLRVLVLVAVVFVLGNGQGSLSLACAWPGDDSPGSSTIREVTRMELGELDQLFVRGQVGSQPVGSLRGPVLYVADARFPRGKAHLLGVVWKGKNFHADGSFDNQWIGFSAISSRIATGPSWFDGQPCFVLEYPPGTAVFGNARDEIREIAPGLFLGRFYERCPCPKFQGYFVLELRECLTHKCGCR